MEQINEAGGVGVVVRSVEDAMEALVEIENGTESDESD